MNEQNIPIPGHENEKIIIFTRRHLVSMLSPILIVSVMFLVPILVWVAVQLSDFTVFFSHTMPYIIIGAAIYYLVMATYAFTEWVSYYFSFLVVTENDIIDINQRGIFNRHITEVSLLRVQDVSAQVKGFLPTFFNYGDVIAESAGENTQAYVIDNIPKPMEIASKILEMHNEHIAREERTDEVMTAEGDLRKQPAAMPTDSIEPQPDQPCPSYPLPPSAPLPVSPPPPKQGNIQKEDLDQGGEIKF